MPFGMLAEREVESIGCELSQQHVGLRPEYSQHQVDHDACAKYLGIDVCGLEDKSENSVNCEGEKGDPENRKNERRNIVREKMVQPFACHRRNKEHGRRDENPTITADGNQRCEHYQCHQTGFNKIAVG